MADLAASDVTISVEKKGRAIGQRRHQVKITFGDGSKTYPSGGVPLPSIGNFGFVKFMDDLTLSDADDSNGIVWKYDRENQKLRAYRQNIRTGSTATADSTSGALAEDSQDAETALRAMGTSKDSDVDIGLMKEAASSSFAPPAQTLYAEAYGW